MTITFSVSTLYFLLGVIIGCSFTLLFLILHDKYNKISGILQVDIKNNLCRVMITSKELSNNRVKKAIFLVDHRVDLSRDEQRL